MMEDATHFFFHCIKYIGERQVFNDTVREFQPLTTNLILFGSENWNIETNMVLFRAIHRNIHTSKRFCTLLYYTTLTAQRLQKYNTMKTTARE